MPEPEVHAEFYRPTCGRPVADPLVCGDCHTLICRLRRADSPIAFLNLGDQPALPFMQPD